MILSVQLELWQPKVANNAHLLRWTSLLTIPNQTPQNMKGFVCFLFTKRGQTNATAGTKCLSLNPYPTYAVKLHVILYLSTRSLYEMVDFSDKCFSFNTEKK